MALEKKEKKELELNKKAKKSLARRLKELGVKPFPAYLDDYNLPEKEKKELEKDEND
jgi:S-adenosylmethionine:tRNA-ribosyltransferase-isomerase (queuine synthetase)